ncbi:unnamed protein product [Sphagnum troendelagicum]|uniref:Secreted protein n=1 Tax=Sphagnum troendelagicum TaxID=128251 RepID=A0ABP0UH13_9BRYO
MVCLTAVSVSAGSTGGPDFGRVTRGDAGEDPRKKKGSFAGTMACGAARGFALLLFSRWDFRVFVACCGPRIRM